MWREHCFLNRYNKHVLPEIKLEQKESLNMIVLTLTKLRIPNFKKNNKFVLISKMVRDIEKPMTIWGHIHCE